MEAKNLTFDSFIAFGVYIRHYNDDGNADGDGESKATLSNIISFVTCVVPIVITFILK